MNILPKNVQRLISLLKRVPGLGPKSAARMAMYMLKSPESYTKELGDIIASLYSEIKKCSQCQNITTSDPCDICSDPKRDRSSLCVVEDPLDVLAFEESTGFRGIYHVLQGVISPVNGIGPDDLTIESLISRLQDGEFRELILATNPNIEGEATSMYIKREIETMELPKIKITRLARGLPNGADLEYTDRSTLERAFEGRIDM